MQWQRSAVRSTAGCIQSGLEKVIASYQLTPLATIGDQIVDTLSLNGVYIASKNKTIHTHPSPLHSKLGCLLFSTSSLNTNGTTLHMEGIGREKLHFSLLELAECQKGPLGKSVLN